ncbi:UPF0426 protein At1g28150, chloroplastic [Wolffia australiana]
MAASASTAASLRHNQPLKCGFCRTSNRSVFLLNSRALSSTGIRTGSGKIQAFLNPLDDPIAKEALKEPIAFLGGMFAGLLRLDLNEEPLKDWIARTAEAAGTTVEELTADPDSDEDSPQEIQID